MFFNLFKKSNKSNNIDKEIKNIITEPVSYKIYSISNEKNLYYAEARYEKIIIRTVLDKTNLSFDRCLIILNDRFDKIIKEASNHSVCSYPHNRTGRGTTKFVWDKSKIKPVTHLSKKKLDLILKVSSSSRRDLGGLSECYVSLI